MVTMFCRGIFLLLLLRFDETDREWDDEQKWLQSNFIALCLENVNISHVDKFWSLGHIWRRLSSDAVTVPTDVWVVPSACVHERTPDFTSANKLHVWNKQKLQLKPPVGTGQRFLLLSFFCAANFHDEVMKSYFWQQRVTKERTSTGLSEKVNCW